MHLLGLHGMPRRVYTYPAEMGWGTLNMLASVGALLMACGVVIFLVNAVARLRAGVAAGDNPWNAGTLEWATSSPPPHCNFLQPPTVAGREPLWDEPARSAGRRRPARGRARRARHARARRRTGSPVDFPAPVDLAVLDGARDDGMFIWSIFTPWGVVYGALPVFVTMVGWFWPKRPDEGGTQLWPFAARTLPRPDEAPAPGGAI